MNWQELMQVDEARQALEAHYTPDYTSGNYVPYVEPPQILVAVLDDGCDVNHPHLKNAIGESINFEKPKSSLLSDSSHGTLSAGLVAGDEEEAFLGGVARKGPGINTSLIAARYNPDSDKDAEMLKALCESGARVISCSWGYGPGYFSAKGAYTRVEQLKKLIKELSAKYNTLFVFAAGNEGKSLGYKDVSFADCGILVAATLNQDSKPEVRSTYCNYGAGITLCAPGSDQLGLCPISTSNQGKGDAEATGSTNFDFHANTSAACPMVAGVAALVMAANPALTAQQVKTILCNTADKVDPDCKAKVKVNKTTLEVKWTSAAAVLMGGQQEALDKSLWASPYNIFYGFGRVNALAAVQEALKAKTKQV